MKKKLNVVLKYYKNEQGFAMPIAVGLGLILLLIAATLILRSQGDQVTASDQKSTAQSLSAAEAGVTRVQQFLNNYRSLATVNYSWSAYVSNTTSGLGCATTSTLYTQAAALDGWQTVDTNQDQFKVDSYTYNVTNSATNTGQGTLVVEGRSPQGATTTLQVTIPVQRKQNISFPPPGVWASSYSIGNNKFQTDAVVDSGCTSTITSAQEANFSAVTPGASVKFIRNPSLTLPGPLTVPTQCPSPPASITKPCAIYLAAPLSDSDSGNFPRSTDTSNYPSGTGTNGEYIYYIPEDANHDSVKVSGSNQITIPAGSKVSFYLQGNFIESGNDKVVHTCGAVPGCSPTDFQIFGGQDTTQILIKGTSTLDAFIFAPNSSNSGIDGNGQVRGSMWVKGWNASNANHIMLIQTAAWNNIPPSLLPPSIDPISSWQRQEAP